MQMKKILVPIDGSEQSKHALARATYIAEHCEAQLTILTVIDLNKEISSFERVSTGGYIPSELKEKGYQLLTECMHDIPREVRAKALVEIGSPAETVVEVYEREQSDLIVIGSRGLNNLKQLVMGSVSQYVLHHASCPVCIVK
jgi:nucleotide-binding universal stress UspA family protein